MSMQQCTHASAGENCPICDTPCPGTCIFAGILKNMDMGIVVLDITKDNVVFQNKAAADYFTPSIAPRDYHAICNLLLPDLHNRIIADDYEVPRQLDFNGRVLGYSLFHIASGFVWLFIRDITDKIRLESIAEAVNTMNNIGYVFTGIRHEIGNPINSIKMTLSVLKNNLDTYSRENIKEYVDRSLNETLRVEYLLKSLKSFSMFEKTTVQKVDLPELLDNLQSLSDEDFSKKGIEILTELEPDVKMVCVDPRALQQVLLNLLTNASDALSETPEPEIRLHARRTAGLVWLTVIDNGCGVPPENATDIFKPFYTTKPHGTGLGLVISKKMLANMNCTIDLKSERDRGTSVTISIPEGCGER